MECVGVAVISTVVERVVNYTFNLGKTLVVNFGDEHQASADEIKSWSTMLGDLDGILQDAQEKQSGNRGISRWLTDLADLAYEIEDVLEEFVYESKLLQQQQQENRSGWNFFREPKRKRSEVPDKLKQITVRLNKLYKRKKMLNLYMANPSVPKQRQIRELDSSESIEPIIYGRGKEKDEIVKLLLESNNGSERVGVIPIVGMGGIGKTTLAQHVLKDERVVDCFEIRIWVCVSMEYNKCRIYKRIIETVTSRPCDVQDECSIEDKVRSELRNKKFLIIIDDLWNEDMHAMNNLFGPFQFGAPNSKIVITTRIREIANQLKTANEIIELDGLLDEDCWSIFCSRAKLDTESPLVAIGKELTKKCAGNPLAAAVMGGLLRGNRNKERWMSVSKDASLLSEKGQDKIKSVLKMSYDAMPDCLKPCFLFCTIFPEDYKFIRDDLVLIWISSGLINTRRNGKKSIEEEEDFATSCFDELVSRSLLSNSDDGYTYVMHDLIRDMGRKIICNPYNRWENEVASLKRTRYLTVDSSLVAQVNHRLKEEDTIPLRILLVTDTLMESVCDIDNFISKARKLRVLLFDYVDISKIPKNFGQMIHLRYLDISGCDWLKEVPSDIGSLINLKYLCIRFCENLTTLPSKIGSLINLIKLECWSCKSLTTIPSSEIGNLIDLRYLILDNCQSLTALPMENICNLTNLVVLNICKSGDFTTLPLEIGNLINLRSLDIGGNKNLTTLPSEIGSLSDLEYLSITDCKNLTTLPSEIGSLSNLTTWNVSGCKSLTTLPSEIGSLINLPTLNISGCKNLTTLPSEIGSLINLKKLDISGNKNLTTLPLEIGNLSNLTTLNISGCKSLIAIPSEVGRLINLKDLDISSNENLTTLPLEIFSLINLTTLNISGYKNFTTLPSEIGSLINLKTLNISGWESLTALPLEINSLVNLTTVNIRGCENLIRISLEPLSPTSIWLY